MQRPDPEIDETVFGPPHHEVPHVHQHHPVVLAQAGDDHDHQHFHPGGWTDSSTHSHPHAHPDSP
jgi:hypothetical protein